MDVHKIADMTRAELEIFGVLESDILVLLVGLILTFFFIVGYKLWRFHERCNKVSCNDMDATIKKVAMLATKIMDLEEKVDAMTNIAINHDKDMMEVKANINTMGLELSKLTGAILGSTSMQKNRKVITHDS